MEGLILPEGSGDEESPEDPLDHEERAAVEYLRRIGLFETMLEHGIVGYSRKGRRRRVSDYTGKNCEEASAERWAT